MLVLYSIVLYLYPHMVRMTQIYALLYRKKTMLAPKIWAKEFSHDIQNESPTPLIVLKYCGYLSLQNSFGNIICSKTY